jgi:hypothetical protein
MDKFDDGDGEDFDLDFAGMSLDIDGSVSNAGLHEVWGDLDFIERDSMLDMERDSRAAVGMVILGDGMDLLATHEFTAEVWNDASKLILGVGFEPILHIGSIRQAAKLVKIEDCRADGEKPRRRCRFKFLHWPVFVQPGDTIVGTGNASCHLVLCMSKYEPLFALVFE